MKGYKLTRFWQEIKRRNVHRSLAVYGGTAFIILEAADMVFPRWGLPDWTVDITLYILILGAIITAIISWIFDVSPEGVKKTRSIEEVPEGEMIPDSKSWKIATYVSVVVIFGLIFFNVFNSNRLSAELYNLEKSIAVLPFDNLSYDAAQLWFTEGISDVIISQLTKISGLTIIGRKSSQKYREKEKNIAEIGEELGVNFVIDGTVQKQGKRIRIVTQLIRVKNEAHIWSDVYDSDWEEIFEIQMDIAKKVASSLHATLLPEETEQIEHMGTEDPEALEYYLEGNRLMQLLSEVNCWRAINKYQQAIAVDINYAKAYAGLALAYFELTIWDVPEPDSTLIPVAKKWAIKALELNVNLGEPHYILGAISYHHDRDWKAAERAFKTGMELDPNNIWGRNYYANFLSMMRRFEESIAVSEHSIKLNPLDPYGYLELAFPLNQLGQKEKAFELVNRSLELHPGYYNAKWGLAGHYLRKGINLQYVYDLCEEELGHFNNDLQKIPSFRLGGIGQLLAMAGGQEEVESILNELIRRIDAGTEDTPYLALGIIYTVLGETEKAIDYIEKSYEVGEPFVFHINMRPGLDTLRSNRRFQDLLKKMGFET